MKTGKRFLGLLAVAAMSIASPAATQAPISDARVSLRVDGRSLDDLQSGSIAPGVEVDIPLTRNWLLKPFGQAGIGWDMKSSNNTFIWGLGSRTRAWFLDDEKLLIGGELLWAGNEPKDEDEERTTFSRWAFGAEYKFQTDWRPFGYRVSWHPRAILWWYGNEVNFLPPPDEQQISRSLFQDLFSNAGQLTPVSAEKG